MRVKLTFFIILLAIIAGISSLFYLTSVKLDGKIVIARSNRNGSIEIYHDKHGIPRIFAKSLQDGYYGLGWVHAQHRLWSLHLKRMLFTGNLASMFGSRVLRVDKYMRTMGFLRSARNDLLHLDERSLQELQAYADGVNDYVASLDVLPVEFLLTQTTFEKWTPLDSLVFCKFMSWTLTHDWLTQLFRTRLATLLGKERACELIPCSEEYLYDPLTTILNDDDLKASGIYEKGSKRKPYTESIEVELPDYFTINSTNGTTRTMPSAWDVKKVASESNKLEKFYFSMVSDLMSNMQGSNSWVISGNHTTSGKPLLANDPHLDNSMPSVWVQAELNWGKNQTIMGGTLPGLPNFAVAKTPYVAWGVTTLYGDTADIYKEKLNDEGDKYYFEGEWYDIVEYHEPIKVKGGSDVDFVVKATRHGPLLTDVMETFHEHLGAAFVLNGNYSFAWTGHIHSDHSYNAMQSVVDAKNLKDFQKDTRHIYNPVQNLVGAFSEGDIFYTAIGLLPVRNDQYNGGFVLDGTKKSSEWVRYANKSENPQVYNPKKGYVVTANNKFATDNMKNNLSRTQTVTARAARIQELIEEQISRGEKFTVEDMKRIQLDTIDVYARDNIGKILNIIEKYHEEVLGDNTAELFALTNVLKDWKGSFDGESTGAAIFAVWEYLFNWKLFTQSGLTEDERGALFSHMYYDQFFFRYIGKWSRGQSLNESFCENQQNQNVTDKPCVWNLIQAMSEVHGYLTKLLGPDMSKWKWSAVHQRDYTHAPFSSNSVLKLFYHRSRPSGGNRRTVNVAVYHPKHHDFKSSTSANLRMIVSLDQKDQDYFVIDTGSFESPLSGHYDDQMDYALNGEYLEMSFTKEEELPNMKHKLTLEFIEPLINLKAAEL